MTPTLCSIPDAARSLGVSQERVRQYVREGRLAADRVGPVYVIHRAALKGFTPRSPGRPRKVAQETGTGRVEAVAVPAVEIAAEKYPAGWLAYRNQPNLNTCAVVRRRYAPPDVFFFADGEERKQSRPTSWVCVWVGSEYVGPWVVGRTHTPTPNNLGFTAEFGAGAEHTIGACISHKSQPARVIPSAPTFEPIPF